MNRLIANLFRLCSAWWQNTTSMLSTIGSLYASRFWLLAYILSGLLFVVAGIPIVAGIAGQFYPRPDMIISFYGGLAEREKRQLEAETAAKDKQADATEETALFKDQETTPFGSLLYRRVLQAEEGSQEARYVLALAIAREKKVAQARQQMQGLAPDAGGGYPQAHAWLAVDMLGRLNELAETDRPVLLKHLEEADKWEDCNPALRAAYAELLAGQGDAAKAIPVLERAAKQDPKLRVMLTALAKQAGLEEKAAEVSGATEDDLEERVNAETPNPEDIIQLASLMLVKGDTQRCRELIDKGLRLDPGNATMRRLASNSLLVDFRKTVNEKADGLELNLDLLDAALKADPTNPELSVDLARAINLGIKLPPEMNEKLEAYLASGRASGLLHLMFANQKIIKGDINGSIPHLEIADRLAPKSPIIMNNLALALALTDRSQLERAFGLITEAIKVAGEQVDLVDTQGQINLIAGRAIEAIACFEKVLAVNPNAIETRKMLAEAYKLAGMESLAQKQQEVVESLQKGGGK
jgi:tetratricopeptide (TPR) repeat protein